MESNITQEEIFEKYPDLYKEKDLPVEQTAMCWGLDVPSKWLSIIERLSNVLTYTYRIGQPEYVYHPKFTAKQVKIKFGELRFYYSTEIEVERGEMSSEAKIQAQKDAERYADGAIKMASKLCELIELK